MFYIGFRRTGSDFSAFLKEHKSPILHDLQHFNTSNGSETYWSVSYANYKFPPQIRRQNLKFLNWHKSIRIFFDIQTFLRKLSVILDWKTECVLHSRPLTANMHQAARIWDAKCFLPRVVSKIMVSLNLVLQKVSTHIEVFINPPFKNVSTQVNCPVQT